MGGGSARLPPPVVFENQYAMTMPPSPAYMEESAEVGVMMISQMAGHFSRIIAAT